MWCSERGLFFLEKQCIKAAVRHDAVQQQPSGTSINEIKFVLDLNPSCPENSLAFSFSSCKILPTKVVCHAAAPLPLLLRGRRTLITWWVTNGILCTPHLYIGGYPVCMIPNDDGTVIVIGTRIRPAAEDDGGDIEYRRFYLSVTSTLTCTFGSIMLEETLHGAKPYCQICWEKLMIWSQLRCMMCHISTSNAWW